MTKRSEKWLAAGDVPEPRSVVIRSCQNLPAVRTENSGIHYEPVGEDFRIKPGGSDIPEPRFCSRSRQDLCGVRTENSRSLP
jgi:hypothetical protein